MPGMVRSTCASVAADRSAAVAGLPPGLLIGIDDSSVPVRLQHQASVAHCGPEPAVIDFQLMAPFAYCSWKAATGCIVCSGFQRAGAGERHSHRTAGRACLRGRVDVTSSRRPSARRPGRLSP